jgi:thiosulfate dehydrogenase
VVLMRFFNAKRAGLELVLLVLGGVIAGCSGPCPTPIAHPSSSLAEYEEAAIPTGSAGEKIRLGKHIFDETPKYASAHVGNQLSCSDCHIQSGRAAYSAPMIDIAGIFPRYNKRAGRVISLQERFQECFTRSENGGPLPEDGKELNALIAYVNWLSRDGVKGKAYPGRGFVNIPALTGNPVKGKAVSTAQCACCHGADGAGVPPVLPPLWGNHSYNEGAGMNNVTKLAAFLVHNMPQNDPGSLSSQDAYDLAAYIHRKPRPKFNQAYKSF